MVTHVLSQLTFIDPIQLERINCILTTILFTSMIVYDLIDDDISNVYIEFIELLWKSFIFKSLICRHLFIFLQ